MNEKLCNLIVYLCNLCAFLAICIKSKGNVLIC